MWSWMNSFSVPFPLGPPQDWAALWPLATAPVNMNLMIVYSRESTLGPGTTFERGVKGEGERLIIVFYSRMKFIHRKANAAMTPTLFTAALPWRNARMSLKPMNFPSHSFSDVRQEAVICSVASFLILVEMIVAETAETKASCSDMKAVWYVK